jgi:hypothetical protein
MMREYAAIHPDLPRFILQVRDNQLERDYKYASRGQWMAIVSLLLIVSSFTFLVIKGHTVTALLGTGMIAVILAFIRGRLVSSNQPTYQQPDQYSPPA